MQYFDRCSYTKASCISLLFHGVLIVCFVFLGPIYPAGKPAGLIAIEVDLAPAVVIDKEDQVLPVPPDSQLPAPAGRSALKAVPAAARAGPVSSPMPKAASGVLVANAVSAAAEVIGQASEGEQAQPVSTGTGTAANSKQNGGGRTAPTYRQGSKPAYPQTARKAGLEGAVVVRLLIDTNGVVASASIKQGSGYDFLDQAALQAVKNWRFSPAKEDGVSIASFHDVRVRFSLDEAE